MLKGKRVMIYIWSGAGVAGRQRDSCNPSDVALLRTAILFVPFRQLGSVGALDTGGRLGCRHTGGGCSSVPGEVGWDRSWPPQCCSQTELCFPLRETHGRWEMSPKT